MNIEEKIRKYSNMVYRVAYTILKNEDDCQDIYQETFFKFYENIKKLKSEEHEKAWLIRVTINNCNMLLRKRKYVEELDENIERTEEEKDNEILKFVNKLSEKYRLVIFLFYFEGYKISEISKILRESEGTIKSRLSRARDNLEEMIKEEYEA